MLIYRSGFTMVHPSTIRISCTAHGASPISGNLEKNCQEAIDSSIHLNDNIVEIVRRKFDCHGAIGCDVPKWT
jgi:hypothetical protein